MEQEKIEMELKACDKCWSMTNHNKKTGECLRCKAKEKANTPKPERPNRA